jgi:asparagine synthase (glutamine-hydrolysing)
MSALFCWLRKDGNLPPYYLEAAQKLLAYRGRMRSKELKKSRRSTWQGVISVWGDASLFEENGNIIYSAQTATGIKASEDPNRFLPARLDEREGWWVLLRLDRQTSIVTLARDRFSGYPLYLYQDEGNFILSSEIKPLRAAMYGKCPVSFPRVAGLLSSLLPPHFGFNTLFEHIHVIKPAHLHQFDLTSGTSKSTSYTSPWSSQPLWENPTEVNLDSAAAILKQQVHDTVLRNFSQTQGIALSLSGGVDSSILAVELKKTGIPFSAFSVTYPECNGEDPDESARVKLTAKHLGLPVHWVEIRGDDYLEFTDELVFAHEEPLSTPGLTVAWLANLAIQRGFTTVALGRNGGVLFSGLPPLWLGALFEKNPVQALREWRLWRSSVSMSGLLNGLLTFFSPQMRKFAARIRNSRFAKAPWLKISPQIPSWYQCKGRDYASYRLAHAFEEIVPVIFNWDERRMTHTNLKILLPYIDLTYIRSMKDIASSFAFHSGCAKYLARRAYSNELPGQVIWDRRKLGFDVPLKLWFNNHWQQIVKDEIFSSVRLAEIVNISWIQKHFDSLPLLLRWRLYTTARFLELFL